MEELSACTDRNRTLEDLCDYTNSNGKSNMSELSTSSCDLFNDLFKMDSQENVPIKCEIKIENIETNHPEIIDCESSVITVENQETGNLNHDSLQNDLLLSSSLESVNEQVDLEDKTEPDKKESSSKNSIRDRISSRFAHARERRRKISLEKNIAKNKKKDSDKFLLTNYKTLTMSNTRRLKLGVVTVALIEAHGWQLSAFSDRQRQLLFRFKLGSEKIQKSKIQRTYGRKATWKELITINLYDDTLLNIFLFDRDVLIGKTWINIMALEKEKTHRMKVILDPVEVNVGKIEIFILVTISGIDDSDFTISKQSLEMETATHSFMFPQSLTILPNACFKEIGVLNVSIYCARGLLSGDYCCVVQFGNERRQTPTETKTSDPDWTKHFTFIVYDITEYLIFTILDDKKQEEYGKVLIPLLSIENEQRKFYAIKDLTLKERAKGINPRLFLELSVNWNITKASIRVINPKEELYMETEDKIDRHLFARNVNRVKSIYQSAMDIFRFWKAMFEWESKIMNIIGLIIWIPFIWHFKVWMYPLLVAAPFFWYRWRSDTATSVHEVASEDASEKERQSISQRLNSLQEIIQNVQNTIGLVAQFGERIKNLYNFSEPFLSYLAILLLILVSLVMFLVPTRIIFIVWGIHKFARKIYNPKRIPNNEVLDLLSRVPDDEILANCQDLDV